MEPAFKEGDYVLLQQLFCKPNEGDAIVLTDPRNNKGILKRVTKVKSERCFVTGDNRIESTDSRHFGWIKSSNILGKVLWRIPRRRGYL